MIFRYLFLFIYYVFARHLPSSRNKLIGSLCKKIRYFCCNMIFASCGENVNIERKAFFGSGFNISIGDYSGLGENCKVPSDIIIGDNVMIGPNFYVHSRNHNFKNTDIPIRLQGFTSKMPTIIKNNIWIGRDVMLTPGRTIEDGTIIGTRALLTKDFPKNSIVGGNPAKVIKSR